MYEKMFEAQTKEQAQAEVQRLLGEAGKILAEAEKIMDKHRLTASFLDRDYCPRDLTQEELDDEDLRYELNVGPYIGVGDGGCWQGSSDLC